MFKHIYTYLLFTLLLLLKPFPVSAIQYTTHIEPPHPCLYMSQPDVDRMIYNVQNYEWAQTLWDSLQAQIAGGNDEKYNTIQSSGNSVKAHGSKIVRLAVAYLISGDSTYAEQGLQDIRDMVDSCQAEGLINFHASTWFFIEMAAGYDLLYNYIKEHHPGAIQEIRDDIASLNMKYWDPDEEGYNQTVIPAAAAAMRDIILGDTTLIRTAEGAFRKFVDVSLGSEGMQAEEDAYYNLYSFYGGVFWAEAMHNLYVASDSVLGLDGWHWTSPHGGSFKTWALNWIYTTMPNGWSTYQGNHIGAYYNEGLRFDRTVFPEFIYTRTKDPLAGWMIKNLSGTRDIEDYDLFPITILETFPALHHGSDVSSISSFPGSNISVHRAGDQAADGRIHGGLTILRSGDAQAEQTEDGLYMMMEHYAGGYQGGGTRSACDFKLYMYGKGAITGWEVWRGRAWYMKYKFEGHAQDPPGNGGITKFADIDQPEIKLVTMDDEGELNACSGNTVRTIGVTDDYFFDFLLLNGSAPANPGEFRFIAPLGGTSGTLKNEGTIWTASSDKVKTISFAQAGDDVTFVPASMTVGNENSAFAMNHTMDWDHVRLRINRADGPRTKFCHIYEPHTGTSRITGTEPMSLNDSSVTSIKITAGHYTDYLVYAHETDTYSAVLDSEFVNVSGEYGYIRCRDSIIIAHGDGLDSFTVMAPEATELYVNGGSVDFTRTGDYISYPGAGGSVISARPLATRVTGTVPAFPNPLRVGTLTALIEKYQAIVYDVDGRPMDLRHLHEGGIYLVRINYDQPLQKVILMK